jgi:hypothetical protein
MNRIPRADAIALLQDFVNASLAMMKAKAELDRSISEVNETDLEGLFLVGSQIVRVRHPEELGERVELVGGVLNLSEEAWELSPAADDIEPSDNDLPY